jgi:hypothetical protein
MYIGNFADTAVYEKVCKVLKKTSLVKGIKKASPIAKQVVWRASIQCLTNLLPK